MAREDVSGRISEILSPFLKEKNLDLYKVEYKKEGRDWVLRVILDKPADAAEEYVSITECEETTRFLDDILDNSDIIDRSYNLEVCSPGLDRELIKDADYVRFAGRPVEIKTYEQINGSKEHYGLLIKKENGEVVIDAGEAEERIPAEKISKINLAVVF